MTYYSIMLKSMKRNFKNYYIYIMSTIFSVIIYYLFCSIKYNEQVASAVSTSVKVTGVFGATSYIVLFFSMIFIWYSNSFFVKKRKKEIALYSLMGLKKNRIGRMLFLENMVIAAIALTIGIAIGTLFSKLIIMMLLRMLNQLIYVEFTFSFEAAKATVIFFAIIFLLASIHSYQLIYRVKLIELFASARKREKALKTRPILAIISLGLVIYGYWLSQNMINTMFVFNIFIVLGTVILGTYGLFSFFLVFLIKILKRRKKTYYKGNNLLAISNVAYRIKSHTVTLATIAILSASTIASLGMVDSVYYDFKTQEKEAYPFTFTYNYITYNYLDEELNNKVLDIVAKSKENDLIGSMKISRAQVTAKMNYQFEKKFTNWNLDGFNKYYVISNSTYNKAMEIRGMNKQIDLVEDECALTFTGIGGYDFSKTRGYTLDLANNDMPIKVLTIKNVYKQCMIRNGFSSNYIIISDNFYNEIVANGAPISSYYGIKVTNQLGSQKLADDIIKIVPKEASLETYYYHFRDTNEIYVILLFVAFFIGIVFLISTGSIIYFKLITEANDEKERYTILRKIGVSKKDITWSIKKQILLIFLLPLMVGILHSGFALRAFSDFLGAHILTPVIITMVGYTVIYFIYYYLTVNYYKRIILINPQKVV